MIKNIFRFSVKGITISILFLLNNIVYSTPTKEDGFFTKNYAKYIKLGELIYKINNIDINNNDLYEGYKFKEGDNCKF